MSPLRAQWAIMTAIAVSLTACQASTPSRSGTLPAGIASPGPTALASPIASATAGPGEIPPGLVLFHRTGPDEVERYFTIRTDGTDETAVFERRGCSCARLSADGKRILTIGETGRGTWSLLTMNLDGSDQVMTDPHSPAQFRVNGVVRNVDAWYKAFDVKPGDKLYLAPQDRVHIW